MRSISFFLLLTIHISAITCADQKKPTHLEIQRTTIAKTAWDPKKKCYSLQPSLVEAIKHSYENENTTYLTTYLDERRILDEPVLDNHTEIRQALNFLSNKKSDVIDKMQTLNHNNDLIPSIQKSIQRLPVTQGCINESDDKYIRQYIEQEDIQALCTFVAGLKHISTADKQQIEKSIETLTINNPNQKPILQKKLIITHNIKQIISSEIQKNQKCLGGCCVKPPKDHWCSWVLCLPCQLIQWAALFRYPLCRQYVYFD